LGQATVLTLPCRVDPDGAMDNLPTVIMEAMAAALPVVTTDVADDTLVAGAPARRVRTIEYPPGRATAWKQ